MKINKDTLNSIYSYFCDTDIEKGGALLMNPKTKLIISFLPLANISSNSKREFIFSFDELNLKVNDNINNDFEFVGIIHSHRGSNSLSKEDIDFFLNLARENSYQFLLCPIVLTKKDNKSEIKWWALENNEIKEIEIKAIH